MDLRFYHIIRTNTSIAEALARCLHLVSLNLLGSSEKCLTTVEPCCCLQAEASASQVQQLQQVLATGAVEYESAMTRAAEAEARQQRFVTEHTALQRKAEVSCPVIERFQW